MFRSTWLAPLALILALVFGFTGCVSNAPRSMDGKAVAVVGDDEDGTLAHKTHGAGDALAILLLFGLAVVAVTVIVDLVMLPYTIPHHHTFYCTETVVHCCCH